MQILQGISAGENLRGDNTAEHLDGTDSAEISTADDVFVTDMHDDLAPEQDPEQEQERRNLEVKAATDSLRAHTRSASASPEFLSQLKKLLEMAQALPTPVDTRWHAARERQDN